MCWSVGKPALPPDTKGFEPPKMDELVGDAVDHHRIKWVDIGCKLVVVIIGIVMVIFVAVRLGNAIPEYGWTLQGIPLYTVLGCVTVVGLGAIIFAVKQIVESCLRSNAFHQDVI